MNPAIVDAERDEVEQILATLRALAQDAPSPVIRLCLEEARQDIAHLAGAGAKQAKAEG